MCCANFLVVWANFLVWVLCKFSSVREGGCVLCKFYSAEGYVVQIFLCVVVFCANFLVCVCVGGVLCKYSSVEQWFVQIFRVGRGILCKFF